MVVEFLHGPKDGLRTSYADPPSVVCFIVEFDIIAVYYFIGMHDGEMRFKFKYYRERTSCEN